MFVSLIGAICEVAGVCLIVWCEWPSEYRVNDSFVTWLDSILCSPHIGVSIN